MQIESIQTHQARNERKGLFSGNVKGNMNVKIAGLIGALILIVMVSALAPTMFDGLNATNGPTWLNTVLPITVAAGLIFVAWRAFQ